MYQVFSNSLAYSTQPYFLVSRNYPIPGLVIFICFSRYPETSTQCFLVSGPSLLKMNRGWTCYIEVRTSRT